MQDIWVKCNAANTVFNGNCGPEAIQVWYWLSSLSWYSQIGTDSHVRGRGCRCEGHREPYYIIGTSSSFTSVPGTV